MRVSFVHRLAPCPAFFLPSQNVATFDPDGRVLPGSASHWMTQRERPCGNDGPGGWDCPIKFSVHFINVFPLKKVNFPAASVCCALQSVSF